MSKTFEVLVENGKYRFYTKENDYRVFCDRGDCKEWMVFDRGSKALLCMMYELEELKGKIDE